MKPLKAALVALLLATTCAEDAQHLPGIESSKAALGVIPPSEVATWERVGTPNSPSKRFLQAVAFDEARKVVVMFGGANINRTGGNGASTANQETWEWDPATGKWTNRTTTATKPEARTGASMVYDSARAKFVLFGGRDNAGANLQDTWEWEGSTGVWAKLDIVKNLPPVRAQHGMVFARSTGKILVFGGGRNSDDWEGVPMGMVLSLGDTWEYDPTTQSWSDVKPATAPGPRHDAGLVWDAGRNKAVLFGGLSIATVGAAAVGLQDLWEWDPTTRAWTERPSQGDRPSSRYAHAMAFDGIRKMVVLVGGWDATAGNGLSDVWDWNPGNGAWAKRLTGNEAGMPMGHVYSSLVADDGRARLDLIAGATAYDQSGVGGARLASFDWRPNMIAGTRDVWELELTTPACTDRTPAYNVPIGRWAPAMGYNPSTGKVYLFGGEGLGDERSGAALDDTWEWDGQTWSRLVTPVRPSPREEVAMAYDPVRKSMILYGGRWAGMVGSPEAGDYHYEQVVLGDTWELDASGTWTKLEPTSSPEPLFEYGLATDTARNKILLYAGAGMETKTGQPTKDYLRNTVWEWDGAKLTWTDRTPMAATRYPSGSCPWTTAYDEARQKLFLYDGSTAATNDGTSDFWEWDPVSAGWALRAGSDDFDQMGTAAAVYDSIRRRVVFVMANNDGKSGSTARTFELYPQSATWYVRASETPPGPSTRVAFDSKRGAVVMFSGEPAYEGERVDDTWEYRVSNLGNGEGCNAAAAASCASGFCVDGVCCAVAACAGTCKACNVPGSEGTCAAVKAGTVVAGSCDGKACAADGECLARSGDTCAVASACASGFCADGVCCDSACTGPCVACDQTGQVGACRPFAAGSDPQHECGVGNGACKSTCDGVGACVFPIKYLVCGDCMTCDGSGECKTVDRQCAGLGGASGGGQGGSGGSTVNPYPSGGSGGGGDTVTRSGGAGGAMSGSGGSTPNRGGSGGQSLAQGGSGSSQGGNGGHSVGQAGSGGSGATGAGGSASRADAGATDAGQMALKKSGCDCAVLARGQAPLPTAALLVGVLVALVRRRRTV